MRNASLMTVFMLVGISFGIAHWRQTREGPSSRQLNQPGCCWVQDLRIPVNVACVPPHTLRKHRPLTDSQRLALNLPVNLNTADEDTLTLLPGIGTKRARAIVAVRNEQGPFRTIEGLRRVHGIGEKRIRDFKKHLNLEKTACEEQAQ